ncbi:MAG TPA: BTAD domain-containing putative transcriptional regulator [Gemmatimonadaceae bacterium]|nr:BTAD domain-containing putative transcriptional regulator [Gemmatimonadaceae bacterium]
MRYALSFALAIVALTVGAVLTFGRMSASMLATTIPGASRLSADTMTVIRHGAPVAPTAADYARFAAADSVWRLKYARPYTLAELRARGDGTRSPREVMQDRIFELTRRGQPDRATAELEHWVGRHPRDRQALLSLARLLNAQGRTTDAVRRYRQVLSLGESGDE